MNPLFSISHIASSRHSPATFKPIIVAQGCSSALPGDTYAHYRCPTVFLGTTGRHLRPLSLPNGTGLTYSLTSQIPPSLKSLDSSPPPFKPHSPATYKPIIVAQRCSSALPGDTYAYHRRPTVLLGTTGRHFPAIIVAQRCWPDIFTHFTNPSLTQKPRLFSTSLQARTLRRHLSLLSSPNDVHRHFRATFTSLSVAQGYWPDIFTHFTNPPSLKSLDSSPPPFKPALSGDI